MIRQFRRKLTCTTLLTLTVMLALMVGAINLVNALTVRAQICSSLEMLVTGGGQGSMIRQADGETETVTPARERTAAGLPTVRAASMAKITSYCTIRLNKEGELHEWKSNSEGLYDDALVQTLVQEVQERGQERGRMGTQAYQQAPRDYGTLIIALDISNELEAMRELLRITVLAGAGAWLALSLGALLLIRHALAPVQEAFTKQQQFVWDASHELKTPLAVISANAQLLQKQLGDDACVQAIHEEVTHTNEMVQNLLTLARMDAGRMQQEFTKIDLEKLLLETSLSMESLLFEAGKRLETSIAENAFCWGNESLLRQLVSILLTNAMQYAAAGSVITVSLFRQGRHWRVCVHNTGSYISPKEQAHVFDRFYRADTSRSRENGGSGLGLAIAQQIAALHHTQITLKSDVNDGTAFSVSLPDGTEK